MQGQQFAGNQNGGFQTPNTVPGAQPVYGSQTNSYPPPGTNAPKPPSTVTIGQAHGAAGAGYFWVAPGSMAYIFDLKEEVSAIQKDVSDITETLRLMMSKEATW